MSRVREALGAGAGALLASGLLGICAAGLYLRTYNGGECLYAQLPAAASARELARHTQKQLEAQTGVDLQPTIARLRRAELTLRRLVVVSEPKSAKYRFLRKRRYLAHDEAARAGAALDPQRPEDKIVYDLATQVRERGAVVTTRPRAGKPLQAVAAFPLHAAGKYQGMAMAVTEQAAGLAPLPAWPIGASVLVCTVLGLLAGAFARRRARYLLIMVATAALALFFDRFLTALEIAYQGPLTRGAAAGDGFVASMPSPAHWVLIPAVLAALGIGLLGALGVGARLASTLRQHRFAYVYILPAALGMLILVFIPFGYGLALGFFDHAHGTYTFVGLRNFVEILSGGGRPITHPLNFYFTLGVTVLWTATNVILHTAIGLGLALLLKDPLLRFKGVYRVLLILPWAVPNYITALIWKGMFHQQYGAVNHALELIGLHKVSWFSSFSTAFTANLATNTWLGFPFMMVVSLGALQSIPKDVYEAAAVDGATPWQTFRRITLPLLRPALFPAIILGSIWTFNMFNIIYLVSEGQPGGATDILITEAYRWAFERADRYGLAAAYAFIIFIILFAYTLLTNRMAKATEDVLE